MRHAKGIQPEFENIEPEVWQFQIGGYQVCDKWLKDSRGRNLSYDDLTQYPRTVETLRRTIELMCAIDDAAAASLKDFAGAL